MTISTCSMDETARTNQFIKPAKPQCQIKSHGGQRTLKLDESLFDVFPSLWSTIIERPRGCGEVYPHDAQVRLSQRRTSFRKAFHSRDEVGRVRFPHVGVTERWRFQKTEDAEVVVGLISDISSEAGFELTVELPSAVSIYSDSKNRFNVWLLWLVSKIVREVR